MTRLPTLKARELIKALTALGFQKIRQKGSHLYFRHPDGRATVVPVHKGEDLGRGLLRSILSDIELTVEAFEQLRKKT